MDSAMQDVASFEQLQSTGTSRAHRIMAREISDSDAESGDEAMDIDDEKPKDRLKVAPRVENSVEQLKGSYQNSAPLQVEEKGPISIDSSMSIHPDAREACIELEMDINASLVDKSLEKSGIEVGSLSTNEVVDNASLAVEAPKLPLMTDHEHNINSIDNNESVKQTEDAPESYTPPAQTIPSDELIKETEERIPDERPDLPAPAVSFFNSTVLKSSDAPETSTQAKDTASEMLEDSKPTKDSSPFPITAQYAQITTSNVPNENLRRPKSPNVSSAKILLINSSANAPHDAPEAPVEDKDDSPEASQTQDKVENNPASSLSYPTSQIHSSHASESKSQQDTTSEPPQTELTPEQKRIASLQSRNASLNLTLTALSHQRTALLHSLSTHLSPYTLADIPSVLKPYRKSTYTPSIASHTTPLPAPITPEDDAKLMAEARQVIKDHIGRLHRYNEIRDVGQGLIGIIAEQRGARIVDCMDEFGVKVGD